MISLRESYKPIISNLSAYQQADVTSLDSTETRGCKRLAWAVIARAVFDCINGTGDRRYNKSARDFLFQPFKDYREMEPYSFQFLLNQLVDYPDLWAEKIREAVDSPACISKLKQHKGMYARTRKS